MKIKPVTGVLMLVAAVAAGYLLAVACSYDPIGITKEGAAKVKVYEVPGSNFQANQYEDFAELHFDPNNDDTSPMVLIYTDQGTEKATWYPVSSNDWYVRDGEMHLESESNWWYRIVILYQLEE
ncbi:MAG: hypothetical protein A2Y64_05120 [Candidatus Coatesbacteria bacterium RBG_13_66_14]|uniref:Uncharacterized protein n=1 Tax=Candidatus Coatesbacteria bacterium RBG_13_66_14 TaxID=1817816 RepID=A0A1F5FB46_9BACT|nr:MAG: hypothetical protein A2Y64_05120 [Candidatus Coatesbacteria bacterium RBG_13_66_14]